MKIKKLMYECLRKYAVKLLTKKMGKCEILEDRILCYVDENKIKRKEKYKYLLIYMVFFIPLDDSDKRVAKAYNLEKPIYYVIENMDFEKEISVYATSNNVIFKNCTFKSKVFVSGKEIIFMNNKYLPSDDKSVSLVKPGYFDLSVQSETVKFDSDNLTLKKGGVKLLLKGKNIEVINSNMDNVDSIKIQAEDVIMESSNISSKEIEIDAKCITSNDGTIFSDIISLENAVKLNLSDVNSDVVFVNGVQVNVNDDINDYSDIELQKKRLEFIWTLKKIQRDCNDIIHKNMEKTKNGIEDKAIRKVLKKR